MNIENILREYPHIPETIQKLNKELNEILQSKNETYNTLKAQKLTGMPHGTETGNQVLDAVQRLIDRYGSRVHEITVQINEWMDMQNVMDKLFYKTDLLTIEERRVIELRYFNGYKWNKIPYMMKYSSRQCERFQQTALEKLNKEYKKMAENGGKIAV